jgi:hypothetical protein
VQLAPYESGFGEVSVADFLLPDVDAVLKAVELAIKENEIRQMCRPDLEAASRLMGSTSQIRCRTSNRP